MRKLVQERIGFSSSPTSRSAMRSSFPLKSQTLMFSHPPKDTEEEALHPRTALLSDLPLHPIRPSASQLIGILASLTAHRFNISSLICLSHHHNRRHPSSTSQVHLRPMLTPSTITFHSHRQPCLSPSAGTSQSTSPSMIGFSQACSYSTCAGPIHC